MDYRGVYTNTFSHQNYATQGTQEFRFQYSLNHIRCHTDIQTYVDIGSGRGVLISMIKQEFPNIKITSVDLEKFNTIDVDFIKADLSSDYDREQLTNGRHKYDLLTCLDVLEHLDKSFIEDVLCMFAKISKEAVLTIANHSDIWDGVELHIIQEDFTFWGPLLQKYFDIIEYEEKYVINGKPKLYMVKVISKC